MLNKIAWLKGLKISRYLTRIIAFSFGVVVALAGLSLIVFAWTEPGSAPPQDNVLPPINGSANPQYKIGDLQLSSSDTPQIDLAIGDNDTGLQQQGDGELAVYTQNNERLRVDSGGQLGVGTDNPQRLVDIAGDQPELRINAKSGDPVLQFSDQGSDQIDMFYSTAGQYLEIYHHPAGRAHSRWYSNGDIYLNGEVGIGTASPVSRLDLGDHNGDIRLYDGNGTAHILGDEDSGESDGIVLRTLSNPSSGQPLFVVESSGNSQRLRVEHDGFLSTSNDLYVGGTGASQIMGSLTIGGNMKLQQSGSGDDFYLDIYNTAVDSIGDDTGLRICANSNCSYGTRIWQEPNSFLNIDNFGNSYPVWARDGLCAGGSCSASYDLYVNGDGFIDSMRFISAGSDWAEIDGHGESTWDDGGMDFILGDDRGNNWRWIIDYFGTEEEKMRLSGGGGLHLYAANGRGLSLHGDAGAASPLITIDNPDNGQSTTLTARDGHAFDIEYPSGNRLLRLTTGGSLYIAGGYHCNGADLAEQTPAEKPLEPATVVSLSSGKEGALRASRSAYEQEVAGVVSTSPGMVLGDGEDGDSDTVEIDGVKLALAGRVPVKVTTENGPIRVGDLLVSSSKPGYAMRGDTAVIREKPGVVLGKSMGSLESGEGQIMILILLR